MHETDISGIYLITPTGRSYVRAVMNHNVARLRRIETQSTSVFKMIRDADKLDIWEILTFERCCIQNPRRTKAGNLL